MSLYVIHIYVYVSLVLISLFLLIVIILPICWFCHELFLHPDKPVIRLMGMAAKTYQSQDIHWEYSDKKIIKNKVTNFFWGILTQSCKNVGESSVMTASPSQHPPCKCLPPTMPPTQIFHHWCHFQRSHTELLYYGLYFLTC